MSRSSISLNKKAFEKKRALSRKEKQNRKANRKAASVGNMVAYINRNGINTDELHETFDKKEIDAEGFVVSAFKTDEQESILLKGRVEHFNVDKGFGFIKDLASNGKYFFHLTDAFPQIIESNMVSFEVESGDQGTTAVNIKHV